MNGQSRKHQWKLRCHEPTLWRPSESGTVSATRNPLCIRLMFEKRPIQRTTDDFVSDLVSIGTEREREGGGAGGFVYRVFFFFDPQLQPVPLVSSDFEGGSSEGETSFLEQRRSF